MVPVRLWVYLHTTSGTLILPKNINCRLLKSLHLKEETGQGELNCAYEEKGNLVNSGPFDGMPNIKEGLGAIADMLEKEGKGKKVVNYRLRDWLISRQRYWGAPIPIVYCDKCGAEAVPEDQLPVILPKDVEFLPTGESPLKTSVDFAEATCPVCGGPATRGDGYHGYLCLFFLVFLALLRPQKCRKSLG